MQLSLKQILEDTVVYVQNANWTIFFSTKLSDPFVHSHFDNPFYFLLTRLLCGFLGALVRATTSRRGSVAAQWVGHSGHMSHQPSWPNRRLSLGVRMPMPLRWRLNATGGSVVVGMRRSQRQQRQQRQRRQQRRQQRVASARGVWGLISAFRSPVK